MSEASSSSPSTIADPKEEKRLVLHIWMGVVGDKKKGGLYGAGDLVVNYRKGATRVLDTSGASTSRNRCFQESKEVVELKRRLVVAEEHERQKEQD